MHACGRLHFTQHLVQLEQPGQRHRFALLGPLLDTHGGAGPSRLRLSLPFRQTGVRAWSTSSGAGRSRSGAHARHLRDPLEWRCGIAPRHAGPAPPDPAIPGGPGLRGQLRAAPWCAWQAADGRSTRTGGRADELCVTLSEAGVAQVFDGLHASETHWRRTLDHAGSVGASRASRSARASRIGPRVSGLVDAATGRPNERATPAA